MIFGDFMTKVEPKHESLKTVLAYRNTADGLVVNKNKVKGVSIFPENNFKPKNNKSRYVYANSQEDVAKITGLSEEFLDGLKKVEGFKLKPYSDAKGNMSIGIGHNVSSDSKYKYKNKITKEQAYNLLKDDLLESKRVLKNLTHGKKFSPNQEEALVDLVFNLGGKKLENSKLIKNINAGNLDGAATEFNYVKIGKNVSTHLCKRRMQNIATFYQNSPSPNSIKALGLIKQSGINEYDREIKSNKGFFSGIKLRISKFLFKYHSNSMISDMFDNMGKIKKNTKPEYRDEQYFF